MNKILKKQKLAEDIYMMQVKAPDVAKSAKPGQFIILQIDKKGERIPLSIADFDRNSITVVFAVVGKTTKELSKLKKGNSILHFTGPLGNPTEIMDFGKVCLVGGGFGLAPLYPIAKALKKAGNEVSIIVGVRNKKLLFWEDKLKKVSKELVITTDDGSKGVKGFVTDALQCVMKLNKLDYVFAVGPPLMMKSVADMTKNRARTVVSLNTIMLDGTGMCGSCRVRIGGEVKFACVDGPDFNAHAVDWNSIINRNKRYHEEEKHACRCGK
jgi:ferredoxin--NADP+ reductase